MQVWLQRRNSSACRSHADWNTRTIPWRSGGRDPKSVESNAERIRQGSLFALKVRPAQSTETYFPVENAPSTTKSKYEPDASFWHDDARYPGVIIEVAYSHKKKMLDRLAEDYLMDSDASVRVVVGLDIEYGKSFSPTSTPCSFSHLATSRCPYCAATPRGLVPFLFSSRLSTRCSLSHLTITWRTATRVECN